MSLANPNISSRKALGFLSFSLRGPFQQIEREHDGRKKLFRIY